MSYITVEEAQAWADGVKLDLDVLDGELEGSVAVQVLAQVAQAYDTSSWSDASKTPSLIRKIIAMMYTGWYINRVYSEDDQLNEYAMTLIAQAERLIAGIVAGTLILTDTADPVLNPDRPSFYPNDAAELADPSIAPKFTMGVIW